MCYHINMIKYNKDNKSLARQNRRCRRATKQEGILWNTFLKSHAVNFTRQYRVDNYILDFYAPSKKLAIEIDGGGHYEDKQALYDEKRTQLLNSFGIVVIRFTNIDIDTNLYGVQTQIDEILKNL